MVLLIVEAVLFAIALACFVAALFVDRSGIRGGDYLTFESRAVLSQRLTLAGFAFGIAEVLVGTPLIGAVLAVVGLAWVAWWLPSSHRRFDVGVESIFDVPPETVAAVMFDVSEQPRWMDSIVRTKLVTPGLLRKGSVILQTLRVSGHELTARLTVNELVPFERLLVSVDVRHAVLFDLFEVLPHPKGALVRYSGRHEMSRVNAVLTGWRLPGLRKRFAERRSANLERLRGLIRHAPLARRA